MGLMVNEYQWLLMVNKYQWLVMVINGLSPWFSNDKSSYRPRCRWTPDLWSSSCRTARKARGRRSCSVTLAGWSAKLNMAKTSVVCCIIIYIYIIKYKPSKVSKCHVYAGIYWSKPGSINTPQKQDENRGFGPGQAAGRTPGKLGGNMPVKLAKMRGKKEQQTE